MKEEVKKIVTISNQKLWFTTTMMLITLQFSNGINAAGGSHERVPAMFVFGDSLVDVGNNNFLSSMAKANYFPYGCDFKSGPTGRFTNGETFVDMLGRLLGIPYLPAFADSNTNGTRILTGVNYASAAAGILDESGQHYGERYSLSQQVLNFETTLNQLRTMMNGTSLSQYLAKSIAILVFGSNDYINNYLMPSMYPSSYNYNPPDFANLLLNRYARQLLALHSVGLRKFVLAGVGPLGCIPNQRATGQALPGRCVDNVNQILGTFNEGLKSLVTQLNGNHPGAVFVYGNTYAAIGDILNNPASYGFSVIDRGCCGIGQGQITCLPFQLPCLNRSQYMFWDAFHPTEVANAILAWRAFSGPPSDCYPINIQQLSLI
ncbi:GDSL esterase/lipase At1g71250 [Juglans microcarpa x Juglans regia]|uniref:GDSL esterase/lipase At1g71250 n=1 Tax=Juglans microcarpa x Juglans regia TaxID=2249226 RepID=UPI001B7DE8A3|nr:GDSL esterase/lipase At1g71250 [Juglans microcarpa x Juglans regia]